jgi:hypothetical protein
MEQSTYLVQPSQVNAVLNFALSAYSGGANRVRGPIRLTGSLNDSACGFVLPALSLERGIVMTGRSRSGEMFL